MNSVKNDLLQISGIYVLIALTGFLTWKLNPIENEVLRFLMADLAMTVVCFTFSLLKKNASVYDAYWSIIPFIFCVQWTFIYWDTLSIWHLLIFTVVSIWSWRLTINWMRSWGGFSHVDWRYLDLAKQSGQAYPIVNLLGIHLFPTLMVFAGMLPLFFIFSREPSVLPLLILGLAVSLLGISFEYFADNELFKFRNDKTNQKETILQTGLWGRCRYPNYLGEILFWLGLAILGQAYLAPIYTLAGAISMLLMMRFISIPMKEKRMLERRLNFQKYQEEVPLLIPRMTKK